MELYNKKYVYFEWDDRLKGKKCFVATDILYIKEQVNKCTDTILIYRSLNSRQPFTTGYYDYPFAYYDPNYEVKKAYNEGKKLQWKYRHEKQWKDWDNDSCPTFFDDTTGYELRVKPEQYLVIIKTKPKIEFGIVEGKIKNCIKHVHIYFEGTYEECEDWIKRRTLRNLQVAYEWEFHGKNVYYSIKNKNNWNYFSKDLIDFDNHDYSLYPNINQNTWYVTFDKQGFVKSNQDNKNEILLFCGSEEECTDFINKHIEHTDALKSYAKGETIECFKNGKWKDINFNNEIISFDFLFRTKHEIDYDTGVIDGEVLDRPLTKEFEKDRIITNKELAMWLSKGNGQFINKRTGIISCSHVYNTDDNIEIDYHFMVRRWEDKEWYDPTYNYCFVGIRR